MTSLNTDSSDPVRVRVAPPFFQRRLQPPQPLKIFHRAFIHTTSARIISPSLPVGQVTARSARQHIYIYI